MARLGCAKTVPGKWPPGALARAGHGRQRAPARPLSARLPPTPHPVPRPAPRQPGGGVSQGRQRWRRLRLAPGRGGGREEEKRVRRRPARPALWPQGGSGGNKTFPARGRGRGGEERGAEPSGSPSWAGPLPLPPGAGEPIRPPRPLLQDPMTQRWEQGGGDWDGSFLTGPAPPQPSALPPCSPSPTLPLPPPPLHNSLPGKGNRNQEGGVLEGRGGPSPPFSQNPQGAWERGKALVPSLHPLETRIAEVGPHKSEIHYCFYCPGAAGGQGAHRYDRAVNTSVLAFGSLLRRIPPPGEPLPADPLSAQLE